jgi:small subunit ribosomal protein S6
MALYEITFLAKEETDPGVRAILEEAGAAIQSENPLGRKRLAYPINKETQAVYTSYVFDVPSDALNDINRRLRLNNQVMRYLLVTKDIVKVDKEVSKAVREAIAAAEKLEDTPAPTIVTEAKVEETPAAEVVAEAIEAAVAEEPVAEAVKSAETKPARKPRAKKAPETGAEATEEERLKALEEKLGDILKD